MKLKLNIILSLLLCTTYAVASEAQKSTQLTGTTAALKTMTKSTSKKYHTKTAHNTKSTRKSSALKQTHQQSVSNLKHMITIDKGIERTVYFNGLMEKTGC